MFCFFFHDTDDNILSLTLNLIESLFVNLYLVNSSISKKNFFYFITLTPSQMWLKRPVYRGSKCEGRCEGRCFYPHTCPHTLTLTLTLPAGKHPACLGFYGWAGMKQWFSG